MRSLYTLLVSFIITSFNLAQSMNGLVAYYPFDGNAFDESGYGNDGKLTSESKVITGDGIF